MCEQAVRHYKNEIWSIYRYLVEKIKQRLEHLTFPTGSSWDTGHLLKSRDCPAKLGTIGNSRWMWIAARSEWAE